MNSRLSLYKRCYLLYTDDILTMNHQTRYQPWPSATESFFGCVAANAFQAIIRPLAHSSLIGNHNLETEFQPLQVASLRVIAHPFVCSLVLPLSTILSRC